MERLLCPASALQVWTCRSTSTTSGPPAVTGVLTTTPLDVDESPLDTLNRSMVALREDLFVPDLVFMPGDTGRAAQAQGHQRPLPARVDPGRRLYQPDRRAGNLW